MAEAASDTVPFRVQLPVYLTGLFSNSAPDLVLVVVPLWALTLDPSPLLIGIVLGCRPLAPMLLSIHSGVLMDRLGARRVMAVSAVAGIAVSLMFPLAPWVPALIALQIIGGMADSTGWVGTQTLCGQILKGNPVHLGRMAFFTRMGSFAGPPLAGLAWDLAGPWGGFATMSAWSLGMLLSTLALPAAGLAAPTASRRVGIGELLPRSSSYFAAFRLLLVPAMAAAMAITILRQAGSGVQSSFYVIYLEGIGIPGTLIGILISVAGVAGAAAALATGPLVRLFDHYRLLIFTTALSLAAITVTPLLGEYSGLVIAMVIRGAAMALSVALILSLIARAVGPTDQGKAMGLRTTCNQATSMIVPVIMGAVVEFVGIAGSFYVIGVPTLVLLAGVAIFVRRPAL
ncbi:MAG: MFS transporter [Alphaproteobacteria bacterium]